MIDRRTFFEVIAGGLLAVPMVAQAQLQTKVFRIGILSSSAPTSPEAAHIWSAFFQGLRELGYVDGRNIVIEGRYYGDNVERLPTFAAELVRLQVAEARIPSEFPAAIAAATKQRAGALCVIGGAVYFTHRAQLVELAAESRLPAIYGVKEFAVAGGLMAYGVDLRDSARRAAGYVDKILKGAKAGDLPIQQPTKFDLVLNLKTARALGLTLPQALLLRADELIQ